MLMLFGKKRENMIERFTLRKLFDTVAPHYEKHIMRAFAPMAASLIDWTDQQSHDHVLDVGTGTGIAARLIAPDVQSVIGIDFSDSMLTIARQMADVNMHENIDFVVGDADEMPFPDRKFSLVIGSFGFNGTDPRRSLPEAYRVLMNGGRLAFQEWGGLHDFDRIVIDTIVEFALDDDDAPDKLMNLRDFFDIERPWYDDLQQEEDYRLDLEDYGFQEIWVKEYQPFTIELLVDDFINYKVAWTWPRVELEAMDDSARGDCLDVLRERLYEVANGNGILGYKPKVIRVRAIK